jgi:catechol 2,3-dioxygenase-like lactoylglutathione lyase family enzyme
VKQVAQVWMMEHLTESPPPMGSFGWLMLNVSTTMVSGSSFMRLLRANGWWMAGRIAPIVSPLPADCKQEPAGLVRRAGTNGSSWFLANDVQRTYAKPSARGVEFRQPPKTVSWGTSAAFADPDGHSFILGTK